MLKEKIVLISLAILAGTVATVSLFYLYQKSKVIIPQKTQEGKPKEEVATSKALFLTMESPEEEKVFDKRLIPITGKTLNFATVVISSEDNELVLKPALDGSFSANVTLLDGVNVIEIMAITREEIVREKRTVAFSTESF